MMKLYKAVYVASVFSEGAFVGGRISGSYLYSAGRVDVRIHDLEDVEGAFCEACAAAKKANESAVQSGGSQPTSPL